MFSKIVFAIIFLLIGIGVVVAIGNEQNSVGIQFRLVPSISFDTEQGQYPSIAGMHNGTIISFHNITVDKLYTYPCAGTGGHTEYIKIENATWKITAMWNGYKGDWHNITFDSPVILIENETYNYTIRTGSYPQIHHTRALKTMDGWINCTTFTDVNGKVYNDWIPSIKLCN